MDISAYLEKPTSLEKGGGGGDSTGMEPWQQAVEARLGELRSDTRAISGSVSEIKVDIGKLQTAVSGLPTKGYINVAVGAAIALIMGMLVLQTFVQTVLVKPAVPVTAQK